MIEIVKSLYTNDNFDNDRDEIDNAINLNFYSMRNDFKRNDANENKANENKTKIDNTNVDDAN